MITTTTPIKLSDIATEYGVAAPYKLTDFLNKPNAPTSLPVSIKDYLGLSNEIITVPAISANKSVNSNGNIVSVSASITYNADGSIDYNCGNFVETTLMCTDQWSNLSPAADGTKYEIRATLTSGSLYSGILNTWVSLDTARNWRVLYTGSDGIVRANLTIEIRDAATGTVLSSNTNSIQASTLNNLL